jgi:hypothetical protein
VRRLLRACLSAAVLISLAGSAVGQGAAVLRARAGWSEWIPLSVWIPLTVEVRASVPIDGALIVEVPSPSGGRPMVFRRAVRLPPGGPHTVSMDVVLPTARHPPVVHLEAGPVRARAVVDLRSSRTVDAVVLAVSREAAGLEGVAALGRLGPAYVEARRLPDRWQGYGGVAAVVLRDLDPLELTASQQDALVRWVVQGGHLVVTGAERVLALRAPWLDDLLPAFPVGMVTAGPTDLPGLPPGVPAARLRPRPGAVAVPSPARAVLARWRYGAGTVTVWGWDAFSPRLRAWAGQTDLWREELGVPATPAAVADLAGVLPSTRPLPGSLQGALAALSAGYILLARAVLRRAGPRRYGWIAVLALSAGATGAMYLFSLSVRAAATAVVQVSVAEKVPASPWARVRAVVGVYAPYGARVRLRAPPGGAFLPAGHLPVTFEGPDAVTGEVSSPGLQVAVHQVVDLPVDGMLRDRPGGLELVVHNLGGRVIDSPRVVRAGQAASLPPLAGDGVIVLEPTAWRPVQRPPSPPARVSDRLLEDVLAALAATRATDSWLVGWMADDRVAVRAQMPVPVTVHHLVVVPLAVRP